MSLVPVAPFTVGLKASFVVVTDRRRRRCRRIDWNFPVARARASQPL